MNNHNLSKIRVTLIQALHVAAVHVGRHSRERVVCVSARGVFFFCCCCAAPRTSSLHLLARDPSPSILRRDPAGRCCNDDAVRFDS